MALDTKETQNTNTEFIDRLVREDERRLITSISRSQAWVLEQKGLYPRRIKLGSRSVCWRLSSLLEWVHQKEQGSKSEDNR